MFNAHDVIASAKNCLISLSLSTWENTCLRLDQINGCIKKMENWSKVGLIMFCASRLHAILLSMRIFR